MKNFLLTAAFLLIGGLLNAQTNYNIEKESETKKWTWSHSNLGNGVSLNYFFEKDQTYEITFWVKTSSNISKPNKKVLQSTINIRTASNTSYNKYEYTLPEFTEYSEVVWSQKAGEKFNQWQKKKIYFTPNYNNLQLWFFPLMTANANDNGGARIEMEIDNVIIKKNPDKHVGLSSL